MNARKQFSFTAETSIVHVMALNAEPVTRILPYNHATIPEANPSCRKTRLNR
jgi:hypothetical protein